MQEILRSEISEKQKTKIMSNENLPLTPEKASQIGVALQRYREIGASAIINPRNEAELTGLRNFFCQVMIDHGNEFMGCWMAVRSEYEPLVQVIERIAQRISSIGAARNAQRVAELQAAQSAQPAAPAQPEPQPAEQPSNIIQLERAKQS